MIFIFMILSMSSLTFCSEVHQIRIAEQNPTENQDSRSLKFSNHQTQNESCIPNICFVLSGGLGVNDTDYANLVSVIDLIIAILSTDGPLNAAAVRYSSIRSPISRLTNNRERFIDALHASGVDPLRGIRSGLASSMRFCQRTMRSLVDVQKFMVVFGDGFTFSTRKEDRIAESFRDSGGEIILVPIGPKVPQVIQRLTGSEEPVASALTYSHVLEPSVFFEISDHIAHSLACTGNQ